MLSFDCFFFVIEGMVKYIFNPFGAEMGMFWQ